MSKIDPMLCFPWVLIACVSLAAGGCSLVTDFDGLSNRWENGDAQLDASKRLEDVVDANMPPNVVEPNELLSAEEPASPPNDPRDTDAQVERIDAAMPTVIDAGMPIMVDADAPRYTLGGTINGLYGSVSLQNHGGDTLVLSANGDFVFSDRLADGQRYLVTVSTQPNDQNCSVEQGEGKVERANVTTVQVSCTDLGMPPGPPQLRWSNSLLLFGGWLPKELATELTNALHNSWTLSGGAHGTLGFLDGTIEHIGGGERAHFEHGTLRALPAGDVLLQWKDGDQEIPFKGYLSLASGWLHACGLRPDGSAHCWGTGSVGHAPTSHAGLYRQLTAGDAHTCGLKPDGSAECWGDNTKGQAPRHQLGPYRQLAAGARHTCGLKEAGEADRSVECWGDNTKSQAPRHQLGPYRQLTAGGFHTCGLKPDGSAECWGDDTKDQAPRHRLGPYRQLAAGARHTCGLKEAYGEVHGSIECWGDDTQRQAPGLQVGPFRQLTAGGFHTCGLKPDGSAECWGDNTKGQAPELQIGPYRQLAAGGFHTCGLKPDSSGLCWGKIQGAMIATE